MTNSRKQLIAQIHQVEIELYKQREQVIHNQHQLSKNIVPILGGFLVISALFFLFKSKNSLRAIANTVFSAGQVVLLAYFKKQIVQFFEGLQHK